MKPTIPRSAAAALRSSKPPEPRRPVQTHLPGHEGPATLQQHHAQAAHRPRHPGGTARIPGQLPQLVRRHRRPREVAEAALGHVVARVEGAYQRSDLLDRRRPVMNQWLAYVGTAAA